MALLQISEPGQSKTPHQHRLAVGIDLGTTNSLVATVRSGEPQVIKDEYGNSMLPSVVRYLEEGAIVVGSTVVGSEALKHSAEDPINTIVSVKRFMGRGMEDIPEDCPYQFKDKTSGMPYLQTRGGDVSPVEVSSEILKVLKQRAESALGGTLDGVVITVPAYFDDAQRQATKDAATLAGLEVKRLLNEPTAAAVAYGLDHKAEGIHAIYDLGGGTFDISLLQLNQGVFEVLATGGDSALGGDDFDWVLAQWFLTQAGASNPNAKIYRALMNYAREIKEQFTSKDILDINLDFEDLSWQGSLSRDKFNDLLDPLIERTIRACKKTLRDAGVSSNQIEEIVMVGGSTRTLRVRDKVAAFFGREPLVEIDPDKVVSLGAALQADVLVGNQPDHDTLLLDVIPLSLGVETMGGLTEKIIPRNTTIPVARAQEFTTFKDGQTAMAIHVVQGERELVEDCRSLARFELKGIPPMTAGAAKIRVAFQVDADGLLSVSAQELLTEVEARIEVKPSYGLDAEDITRMLQESFSTASEDAEARALREEKVEAERMIEALEAALDKDGKLLLEESEFKKLLGMIDELKTLHNGSDRHAIHSAISDLNKASENFASLRMDSSMQKALQGRNIDDLE